MKDINYSISNFFSQILSVLSTFSIADLIDVLIVAFIMYQALRLVRETRAMQFVKSILVILVAYLMAYVFRMMALKFILEKLINVGIIAIIIIFQPEVRRALERLGRSRISLLSFLYMDRAQSKELHDIETLIDALTESLSYFARKKIGALIVIEREIKLGDVIKSGTIIDSVPSEELINNIFFINTPLHDGAVVVRDNRIYAAGCFLPLSSNMEVSRELGTRHRAALGMSEQSDAVILIVSEETGKISIACNSMLSRDYSKETLRKYLEEVLNPPVNEESGLLTKLAGLRSKK